MKRSFALAVLGALLALPLPVARAAEPERLILRPSAGTIFRIEAHYPQRENVCPFKQRKPLLAKYRGRLELVRADDGTIQMINALSFSEYLRGLAEVPLSWPPAALRAQVIAARSYALATMRDTAKDARERGYDICATDQCQVYRGATVELGAYGERWVKAVEDTRGRVLTRGDDPVKAFYFSTSTGRTRRSFASATSGPAYLDRVPGEDGDAPLARWTATIRLADLDDILEERGAWPGGRITRVRLDGDAVRIAGGSVSRTMSKSDFRIALNNEAPCLFPDRYPSRKGTQRDGPLPQTVPSTTFALEQARGSLVLTGRGWGHDVGMSQWGARSLAERGRSAGQILDHYYNARIETVREPEAIRVLAAEGIRRILIRVEGGARVSSGTGSVIAPGKTFEVRGGERLRVRRSRGPRLRSILAVTPTTPTVSIEPGEIATVGFTLTRSARVTLEVSDADGEVVRTTKETSFESGDGDVPVPMTAEGGAALPPGEYRATVEAYDGLDRIRSEPIAVVVAAPQAAPETPAPAPQVKPASRALPIAIASLVLVVIAAVIARRRRASATRT